MTIQVAINGATGRMGKELIYACQQRDDLQLVAAFARPGNKDIGEDAGLLASGEKADVKVTGSDTMAQAKFDVLVDFTLPEPSLQALAICEKNNTPIVIGTTGFNNEQIAQIDAAAKNIPVVLAPNMSAGINLTFQLIAMAAKALGDSVDIEVIETHHRHKVDAPSGTAIKMGEVMAKELGRDLDECAEYCRQGHTGERERQTIGFQTIRGGDIVGDHTVLFAGDGERLEITHKASSRQTFASGSMRAAAWVVQAKPGRYGIKEVLGL